MRIPLPPAIQPTNEILTRIAATDEFNDEWRVLGSPGPETLRSLRRIATIESAGSSTRIEGAKLSDGKVEKLIGSPGKESFQSRYEQEVAGYAYDSCMTWKRDRAQQGSIRPRPAANPDLLSRSR